MALNSKGILCVKLEDDQGVGVMKVTEGTEKSMQQGHPTTNSREHVLDRDIWLPPLDITSARSEKGYVGFYATLSKNLNNKNNF